jgi:sigma-B regulation protein RsbU (phosphoserine phosphatase)
VSESVKLEPGDHLVLFTDGVVEALNLAGEEFGQQRLCDALQRNARTSAPDMLRSLKDDLIAFSANAPQHDDITMMVLGFRENPGI